jgi:rhodanese-related sulfurtransferase
MLGYMAENVMSGACDVVRPDALAGLVTDGWRIIDVRTAAEHLAGAIPGSVSMPLDALRDHIDELSGGALVVYCEVGQRGHTATALLQDHGIRARNLDGGYKTWIAWNRAMSSCQPLVAAR